ncbi:MAG: energy-coupling factor transporter transmembrane component T family protein [Promethearchaeota archaeon]
MSLEFLNAFKFMKQKSFVHNLDPRAKLLFSVVYTIIALLFNQILPLFFIFLTLVPLVLLGKIFKQWIKSIRGLSFLVLFIVILNTWFMSLSFALAMILRIYIMVSAFSIFFLTVDPNDLALSLISMKLPYEFAFSFSLAFRFVPTIANEAQNILDAQQSRGYEMQKKGLISQVKNLFPLLIPLIINSIKRAFYVAEALESRAFGSRKERTYYYSIKYSLKDYLFTFYLLVLLAFIIFIRVQINLLPDFLLWSLPV